MSISDPFNRVSRKRETEYLAFQDRLKEAGIDSEEKVISMLQKSRRSMLVLGAVVGLVTLLAALIWPNLMVIVVVLGSLTLFWLLTILVRGQGMMKQFIQQEFARKP